MPLQNISKVLQIMNFNEANPAAVSGIGLAARTGNNASLKYQIKRGSRLDLMDNRGWTALHEAAAHSQSDSLLMLLKAKDPSGTRDVNCRTFEGESPLYLSCKHQNNLTDLETLISYGADVNLGNNEDQTPLHLVSCLEKVNLARVLLNAGAEVNKQDYTGSTPLHEAIYNKSTDIVKMLLENGAEVNVQDMYGRSVLFVAASAGNIGKVDAIFNVVAGRSNLKVDLRATDGATTLMLAAQAGSLQIINRLLDHGANPNLAAYDNFLAIHNGAFSGNPSVVKRLLEVTDPYAILQHTIKDSTFRNLAYIAVRTGSVECLDVILNSGLGQELLHFPLFHHRVVPCCENVVVEYHQHSVLSELLALCETDSSGNQTLTFCNMLLTKGFSANVDCPSAMPPLVATVSMANHWDVRVSCIESLFAHGADVYYESQTSDVPDALLSALFSRNPQAVLLLLQRSFCDPDSLLKVLLYGNHIKDHLYDVVLLLMRLGIVSCHLVERLHTAVTDNELSEYPARESILSITSSRPVCSLQQLSRSATRKWLLPHHKSGKAMDLILSSLFIPKPISLYLTFHRY